jgi:ribosome biogenesis protein ENP2
VYHVTSGKALPQWLSEAKKRGLRKDEEYRRRLELLQSFDFPAACQVRGGGRGGVLGS